MRVTTLTWNRYRSFKERQRLHLAPVTVIIGRNGSGKSIISRLPLLLGSAVSAEAIDPLDLNAGGIEHAATYQDLVNSRGALPFSLGLEVTDGSEVYEFETTMRHVSETRSLAIELFVLRINGAEVLRADIADENELTASEPSYRLQSPDQEPAVTRVRFGGLLPDPGEFSEPLRGTVERALSAFRCALPLPSYLGPFRVEASRYNRVPSQRVRSLGPRGERAIELLAEDKLRHGSRLVERVSEWFTEQLGQGITVDLTNEQSRILATDHRNAVNVSLSDTGAGFSQALPIVVQHLAHVEARLPTSMLIVEQPELHLHPAAHGALADLILESARSSDPSPPATCIVETHSEQFIMRLRRRIAEGLPPEVINLWSLNHTESDHEDAGSDPLRVIEFDQMGNPNGWPRGVFEESFQDLTAMRRAARDRGL